MRRYHNAPVLPAGNIFRRQAFAVHRREISWLVLILLITGIALSINLTPRVNPDDPNDRRELWPTANIWPQRDVHTRLGLDLRGGTQVLLQAREQITDPEQLEVARNVIEQRVNGLGLTEATVQTSGNDRIIVELPDVSEPEQALATIRSTGKLEFIDPQGQFLQTGQLVRTTDSPEPPLAAAVDDTDTADSPAAQELQAAQQGPLYEVVADGIDLQTNAVQPGFDESGRPIVTFEFSNPSADRLQQFTAQNVGKPLTIVLDNRVQSSPTIQAVLPGRGNISTTSTEDRDHIYNVLRYGSLPVGFDVETSRIVSATLGEDSIQRSWLAGVIGLGAVALFMILYYRLPGVLAVAALLIYTMIALAIYRFIPITLTLAGIAGFILSIGLAVDGNVLIFGRLKEELRRGRSLATAVEEGFTHAWPSIRDSNVATLITTVILYWFGSNFGVSIIQGFAIALGIGIVISLFTSVVITRNFLRLVVASGAFRDPWWYAVESPEKPAEPRAVQVTQS
jgi:preprotein translocase subunit SecD